MPGTVPQLLAVLAAMFLGGAVQGSIGFGTGLVAIGIMGYAVGVRDATVVLSIPVLMLSAGLLVKHRKHFSIERIGWVLPAVVVGVPLGVRFLAGSDPRRIQLGLGLLLIATCIYGVLPHVGRRRWHPVALGVPCGLLSGMLNGGFCTGGPPAVAYMSTQRFEKFRFVAALQSVFTIAGVTRICELARRGMYTRDTIFWSTCSVAAIAAGAWVGTHVLGRMPERVMRAVVLAVLFFLGIRYLLVALRATAS